MLRISPKEIIIPETVWNEDKYIQSTFSQLDSVLINRYDAAKFESKENLDFLLEHFGVKSVNELSSNPIQTDFTTPAVLLQYVKENAKSFFGHIENITFHNKNTVMIFDEATIRNLELLKNMADGSGNSSLLEILDKTVTPMGCRLIKKWIVEPLLNINAINNRLANVEYFIKNTSVTKSVLAELKNIMDLERLVSRFVMNKATPKDLIALKNSLNSTNNVYNIVKDIQSLSQYTCNYLDLSELTTLIENAIKEEPATLPNEGDIIKEGYCQELDELNKIATSAKQYLAELEAKIKTETNISNLRIKYNKIIGYYIEVSKGQAKLVDTDKYMLRQNLVNVNRYTNKELSEYESKILTARETINNMEFEIFNQVSDKVRSFTHAIAQNAKIIAALDVFVSFAVVSTEHSYVRPEINDSTRIYIKNGRHPVIEQKQNLNCFIANDLDIDTEKDYLYIITGPNMAGKSTYLRQCALITLMAQIGCFVPADDAKIGIVDRIFTRIGASDNLARGESTFYVEMAETANILANATNRSLLIMDEIGRGTATYDGMAIAWAVVEYIRNKNTIGAKTLFATHYHELTKLDDKEGIKNFSVAVVEENQEITFLHKIIPGSATKSYGIHVAKLANMPQQVVNYAQQILDRLEDTDTTQRIDDIVSGQMLLFDTLPAASSTKHNKLIDDIKHLNIDRITPLQALNILADIQKKLK